MLSLYPLQRDTILLPVNITRHTVYLYDTHYTCRGPVDDAIDFLQANLNERANAVKESQMIHDFVKNMNE